MPSIVNVILGDALVCTIKYVVSSDEAVFM